MNDTELRAKITGCMIGKAVGGTLGMPYEGVRGTLDLSYYDPVPNEMLPNDDLDLQIVYAVLLDKLDPVRVDRDVLVAAWQHIGMSPDEYGICKRNLRLGLRPPATGAYDNPFTDGMGAAIRTELWACLAAGNPELAARYAYEDACMDHAGEGIYAAQFLAALQSLAFVERDQDRLLDTASGFIPVHSSVRQAITSTRVWWAQLREWRAVRQRIVETYPSDNFTDVTLNLAFIVLGWLAAPHEFGPAICTAVNCGEDTDCTGATLGALLGILDPGSISDRWLRPIGRNLVLTPSVRGIACPPSVDDFTDLILDLRRRLDQRTPAAAAEVDGIGDERMAHLAIRAELGFAAVTALPLERTDVPPMPQGSRQVTFSGSLVELPWERCEQDLVFVKYRVHINRRRPIRLLFNTRETVRVWFDGKFLFGRDGGSFVPAFHRAPINQTAIVDVNAGTHELLTVLVRSSVERSLKWCFGISEVSGSPVCDEWLPEAFERVGLEDAHRGGRALAVPVNAD